MIRRATALLVVAVLPWQIPIPGWVSKVLTDETVIEIRNLPR